jgi:hypothetical protein
LHDNTRRITGDRFGLHGCAYLREQQLYMADHLGNNNIPLAYQLTTQQT